ncbi:DegT/DnrJ/EryC1/StrS family aminotransferase [Alphaproteobacteria bacterium]|nr:DegT/DnrJ/EryC1/StrS family aminotransferase [Alphaproteobacteria bacterium]
MGIIKVPQPVVDKFYHHVSDIFETGNLAEGKWNAKLGEFFKSYTRAGCAIPFSSNGAGLLAVLQLLKRYRNFENIFIQSNTMYGVKTIAITSGMHYLGAVPCSIPSLMPSLEQVKEFLKKLEKPERTVFLLSHIGGIVNPDIEAIAKVCKSSGVALVEDCAHSLGSTLNGSHSGLYGNAGVYSLYATKAIAAGEGGIAVTNDEELGEMLARFNIYDRFDQQQDIGVNFRISEMQALFSLSMCEFSEEIISNKSEIATKYIAACNAADIRYVDPYHNGQRGNHYKFTLIAKVNADEEFGLVTNRTSPVYGYALGDDPESIIERHICLPIWYALEDEVIDKTVRQVLGVLRS